MITLIFLIIRLLPKIQGNILISVPSTPNNFLDKMIASLNDYSLVIQHYETSTKRYIPYDTNFASKAVRLFNYDFLNTHAIRGTNISEKKIDIIAFKSRKYIKMFAEELNSISYYDTVIVLDGFTQENPKNMLDYFYYVRYAFLYNVVNNSLSYCVFKVARNCMLVPVQVSDDVRNMLKVVPINMVTLRDMTYKIGYKYHQTNFDYSFKNGKMIATGIGANLLQILQKKLKFNYELIGFNGVYPKGPGDTMLKNISSGNIDWAVGGILQNYERSLTNDFTKSFKVDSYSMLFAMVTANNTESYQNSAEYLKYQFCVFATCFFVILYKHVATYVMDKTKTDFFQNMLEVLSPLYELSFAIHYFSESSKFVFSLWTYLAMVILNYYKVAALLIILSTSSSYVAVDDLIKGNYNYLITNEDYKYIKHFCDSTNASNCIDILKRSETVSDICDHFHRLFREPLAILGEETVLTDSIFNRCKHYLTHQQKNKLKFTDDSLLGLTWNCWPFRKKSFLPTLFSKYMSEIEASGLLKYGRERSLLQFKGANQEYPEKLGLFHYRMAFKILGVGSALGAIASIGERVYFYKLYKKRIKIKWR